MESFTSSNWFAKARKLLRSLTARTREVMGDSQQRSALLRSVQERIKQLAKDPAFAELAEQAKASVRLVKAVANGQYKPRSKNSLYLVLAGLIYLVLPIDAIPDFLPGGFLDDAAVVGFIFAKLRGELERFREWERWREEFKREQEDALR